MRHDFHKLLTCDQRSVTRTLFIVLVLVQISENVFHSFVLFGFIFRDSNLPTEFVQYNNGTITI